MRQPSRLYGGSSQCATTESGPSMKRLRSSAEAQLNFANLLEDQGQLAEARAHYEIFLRIAPPSKFADLSREIRAKLAMPAQ